ncbi:MAG TPA: hypothetical protein VFX13_16145 [Gaiellales bacterium]|nr:hypothetical protein [Gaiellales bacterium]
MHLRINITALAVLAAVLALSACGQATGGGDSSTSLANGSVAGTVVQSDSTEHTQGATLLPGVKVGLYHQAVHAGGPIAADPPQPFATAKTDAQGRFRFAGLRPGKRYFVFAYGAHGMTIGHWVTPGHSVKLVACRDCAMPL